jgi:Family of unknown function (DUF6159)
MAWSLVTFIAVPVIAIEGTGAFATLKRSASLFRERWGQQITGNLAIGGLVSLLGVLPSAILIAIGIAGVGREGQGRPQRAADGHPGHGLNRRIRH